MKKRSAYDKDMYDCMEPMCKGATEPLNMANPAAGTKKMKVTKKLKQKKNEHKKYYGKRHPVKSIDDLREIRKKMA